ncbi:hypothetical protein [Microbacterium sp. APC 3901]|uniref:hypothetical protein n=1 Tax=Microbacterium sp. APC 3901 TaxID=3035192 RepID=UPI0025B56D29|nr:hypothetical protein [Microbacterium sp. APC 3901]MDN3443657.1 hypothetical protein [Microbacterium sp. APC 3901]
MAAATIAIALSSVLGCAPEPAPVPTPTPAFASEEEAFAAAEEVYRAYNDALNESRITDNAVTNPRKYLAGPALESDIDATRYLQEQGLKIVGEGQIVDFAGTTAGLTSGGVEVTAKVCLDVSRTQVLDASGRDVTPHDRPTRLPLDVAFVRSDGALLISSSNLLDGDPC